MFKLVNLDIISFCNSGWASSSIERGSTIAYCIYMADNLISWKFTKQKIVSGGSNESEYRALTLTTVKVVWLKSLLTKFHVQINKPPIVFCDNLNITYLAENPMFHARMKYIEIDHYFVRDQVVQKLLNM